MMTTDIRWKQRRQNFEMALDRLRAGVNLEQVSDLEKAGTIQIFEDA